MNPLVYKIYQVGPWGFLFHTLAYHLKNELKDCDSVLDLGCGPDSIVKWADVKYRVGIDAFEPYIKTSKKSKIHHKYILGDITKAKFPAKSFDAVILIDVLEHLTKKQGEVILKSAEKWARKKVVIYTPNGFFSLKNIDDNPYQSHLSGWVPRELKKRGYRVWGMEGFRFLWGNKKSKSKSGKDVLTVDVKYWPRLFWRAMAELTELVTYFHPEWSSSLFATKAL